MAERAAASHYGVSLAMLTFRMRMRSVQKAAQRRAERDMVG